MDRDELLERGPHLGALADRLRSVLETRRGAVVAVAGEAGVGKTTLVRTFCGQQEGLCRVLRGNCDALFTPRPLGPFVDVAAHAGGELGELVERGARPHEVAVALLTELRRSPTVVVLEDLHWADEATLDVVSLMARRLDDVPALVLATYRNDELGPADPLRIVLGEMANNDCVTRLVLEPLSVDAVNVLAARRGADGDDIYRRTGGNPFFVTETLASAPDHLPLTVRDAVLARAARLGPEARAALDVAAIAPVGFEYWLLEAVAGAAAEHLDECMSSGMLVPDPERVSFRHELARLAVESALSPARRARLHARALEALQSSGSPDPARLAHHAEAAHDATAVLRFAPAAGVRAALLGAHREAAEQFHRALRFATGSPPEVLADLFDRRAYACYLSGDFPAAVDAQRNALDQHRLARDWLRVGAAARSLSLLLRYEGDLERAWEVGHEAVAVLERLPEATHELAMAYCTMSHLSAGREDAEQTRVWAAKAAAVTAETGADEVEVYNILNLASIGIVAGDPNASPDIRRALDVAVERGFEEHAGRAFVALTWWSPRGRRYTEADQHVDAGLRYCDERGLDLWRSYLVAYRARSHLDRGRWDDAVEAANIIVRDPRTSPVPRITALSVLGLVRARRGDPDAWTPLDEAWELARSTGELQRIEPISAARAEALWLDGDSLAVADATSIALDLAIKYEQGWVVGEMLALRRRAGHPAAARGPVPEPFASELSGAWRRAATAWHDLDSPYESALAMAECDDDDAMRGALERLLQLGARPAAAIVARRLRERGARGVPRGPRPGTRTNPGQLTRRELDVLALVVAGLPNKDIAAKLVVSQRTVDHHVAAILRKLGARTRREAARVALKLGLVSEHR